MGLDAQSTQAVKDSFTKLLSAYSKGKIDEAMSYTAPDDDIVLIEPGPHQIWRGRDKVREGIQFDWDTTEGEMPVEVTQIWVAGEGNVAWANGETKINVRFGGKDIDLSGRFTAIAKKVGSDWKWHTIHIAAPDPRHAESAAWPEPEKVLASR